MMKYGRCVSHTTYQYHLDVSWFPVHLYFYLSACPFSHSASQSVSQSVSLFVCLCRGSSLNPFSGLSWVLQIQNSSLEVTALPSVRFRLRIGRVRDRVRYSVRVRVRSSGRARVRARQGQG
jgi:hypothetical protein